MCFPPSTAGDTSMCSPFASSLRDRIPRSATLLFLLLPGGAATGTAAARALKKCTVLTVDGYAVASGDDALAAAAAAEAKSETDEDELDALNGPAAAVQLLRFFDGQTSFADDQCMLLLSMLSDVERWKRKRFFNETVLCRRRDDPKWKGTDVALVFQLRSGDELEALERIKTAVVTVLRAQGRSVSEMCAEIDVDNDATLAVDEIVNFFSAPAMQAAEGMPTPAELQGLRRAIKACCDLNGDSSISYEEMRHVFTDKVKVRASLSTLLITLFLSFASASRGPRLLQRITLSLPEWNEYRAGWRQEKDVAPPPLAAARGGRGRRPGLRGRGHRQPCNC